MTVRRVVGLGVGLGLALMCSGGLARTVAIGGEAQAAAVDSRVLGGTDMLAVWTLPRLGISVRNDPRDLRLLYGARELRYAPGSGWQALGFSLGTALPAPQSVNGSLYAPLAALKLLGVRVLRDTATTLDFAAPAVVPVQTLPPSAEAGTGPVARPGASVVSVPRSAPPRPQTTQTRPASGTPSPAAASAPAGIHVTALPVSPAPSTQPQTQTQGQPQVQVQPQLQPPGQSPPTAVTPAQPAQPVANLNTVRLGHANNRNVQTQRVVLELSGAAPQTVSREKGGLSILLGHVSATPVTQTLASGDTLSVTPGAAGARIDLSTSGGTSQIFTLDDPFRVVVDTVRVTDTSVPPPIDPEKLPAGVTLWEKGYLHLLSFDPALFQARVVSAPAGRSSDVASLVRSVQGVAGINGGYFDTGSALPVDLVVQGGLMVAPSLERRATVGFTASGDALFGYPRPRYVLGGPFGSVTVNTVGPKVRRDLLTAFVGDGRTPVGADGLTTLYVSLGGAAVQSALSGVVVPPAGTLSLTFDPARFAQLPRSAGQPLSTALAWRDAASTPWEQAQDALSAGPLLVQAGQVVLNPGREMFNTSAGIWRATRQVALARFGGKLALAYFDYGTPEAFAAALAGAGVSDAVRMDSGSSATVYSSSGYAGLGGYLNTVWSQKVPNAIVLVPRTVTGKK